MKNLVKRWDDFWFPQYSSTGLAFFRALLGLLLIHHLLKTEMVGITHMDPAEDYFATGFFSPYFHWLKPPAYGIFLLLGRSCLVFAVMATVGFLTPLGFFAAIGIFIYLFLLNRFSYYNHLYLLILICFLASFMPLGENLSVDSFLRRVQGRRPHHFVTSWAARLMQVTLSLVYLASAAGKTNSLWLSGDLMKTFLEFGRTRSLDGNYVLPPLLAGISRIPFSFQAGLSLAAEYFIALGLWSRKTRWMALGVGVIFHLMIALTLDVSTFSWLMMVCYLLFLSERNPDHKPGPLRTGQK